MPENEITCIFFEIDTIMSTSHQFHCEIERPFTNLNDISTKLAGKTYNIGTKLANKVSSPDSNYISHLNLISDKAVFLKPYQH